MLLLASASAPGASYGALGPRAPLEDLPSCPPESANDGFLPDGRLCEIRQSPPPPPPPVDTGTRSEMALRQATNPEDTIMPTKPEFSGSAAAMPNFKSDPFKPTSVGYGLPVMPDKPKPPTKHSAHPSNGRAGFGMALYVPSTLRTARIVIFGGEGPKGFTHAGTGGLLNDVWDFDIRSRIWSRWPALNTSNGWDVPSARANMSIAIDKDVMVVTCGYARNVLEDTHAYMFGTGRWKLIHPTGQFGVTPFKRTLGAMWSDGTGRLHLSSGVNREGPIDDLMGFNTYTEKWEYERPTDAVVGTKLGRTAAPGPRYGHAVVYADGSAYMFGGMRPAATGRRAVPSNELFELDEEGLAWRPLIFPVPRGMKMPPLPPERWLTACAWAARLWCFGGVGTDGRVFGDTWSFDRALLRWSKRRLKPGEYAPAPRFNHKMVAVGPRVIIIYGGTDNTRLYGDVWALDVSDEGSLGWTELTASEGEMVDVSENIDGKAPEQGGADQFLMSLGLSGLRAGSSRSATTLAAGEVRDPDLPNMVATVQHERRKRPAQQLQPQQQESSWYGAGKEAMTSVLRMMESAQPKPPESHTASTYDSLTRRGPMQVLAALRKADPTASYGGPG